MTAPKKIVSDFAILDVRTGQVALSNHFQGTPKVGPCPEDLKIPVTIEGFIDGQWSRGDGTSTEFSVTVESVRINK